MFSEIIERERWPKRTLALNGLKEVTLSLVF